MKNRISLSGHTMIVLALTAIQTLAQSIYEPYTFTTLAGKSQIDANGNLVPGSADGTGNAARFNSPTGVAVDSAGNVYVADMSNQTVRKMTPAGVVTTLAGLAGSRGSADGTGSDARFNYPYGVAVDSAGNISVADYFNNTIRKVTPAGVVTTLAGRAGPPGSADGTGSAARFREPRGVAVDSAGNIYVADTGNNTIRKVTPAGVVTTLAGLACGGSRRCNGPVGVAVDSTGNVYVADSQGGKPPIAGTIRRVTPAGVVTTLAGDQAGDHYGSADGTGSDAQFGQPGGVAADGAGNLYVSDDHSIRKVTPAGVVTTLAGLATQFDNDGNFLTANPGNADGTGSVARFNFPTGVAVDSAGNVYVADTGNNTIRKGYAEPVTAVTLFVTSGSVFRFNGGQFGFILTGPAGKLAVIEASKDLVNWMPLWTNTFAGALHFSDPQTGISSNRFYRAHLP